MEEERRGKKPTTAEGASSRSFPGNPTGGSSFRANRSLSDGRGGLALAPPNEGPSHEEPLLKSTWMSIVGAAGKFLGRAQERHQWSEARVGMMNRLLKGSKSGSNVGISEIISQSTDEGRRSKTLNPSSSRRSFNKAKSMDMEKERLAPHIGGLGSPTAGSSQQHSRASPVLFQQPQHLHLQHAEHHGCSPISPRGAEWDGNTNTLRLRQRDEGGASGVGTPSWANISSSSVRVTASDISPGLPQHSSNTSTEPDTITWERRIQASEVRRQNQTGDGRPSYSGSHVSTRNSVPAMPPLPRTQQQQAADGGEDHLHGLLNKLRARRLQQEQEVSAGPGDTGTPTRRQGSVPVDAASSLDSVALPTSSGVRFPVALAPAHGSRMMRQRFSALLNSDLERQARAADTVPHRHSTTIGGLAGGVGALSDAHQRVRSWVQQIPSAEGSEEGPPQESPLAGAGGGAEEDGTASCAQSMFSAMHVSGSGRCPDEDRLSEQRGSREAPGLQPGDARRSTHNGTQTQNLPMPPDPRPRWKSTSGVGHGISSHAVFSSDEERTASASGTAEAATAAGSGVALRPSLGATQS